MTGYRYRLVLTLAAVGLLSTALTMAPTGRAVGAQGGGVTITQDVEYSRAGPTALRLDAFVPGGNGPFPGLIAIHGGGWVLGEKAEWDNNCRDLALAGFACFSIDYRLAPEHPYPAALDDTMAAVQWVRDNAAEYHVDPTRLGAIGSSAGGHLAALIGYMGKGPTDTGTRVRVIVLWSAPTDIATLVPDRGNVNQTHSNVHDFLNCDLTDCAAREKQASPATYVDASDPPTMIANSTDEQIPLTQAQELNGILKDAGVPHQLYVVDGTNHGARLKNLFPQDGGSKTVMDLSVEFIRKWIGEASASTPPTSSTPAPPGSFEAEPTSRSGDDMLFLIVATVGVAVVLGMVAAPLLRRRRLR